MPDRSVAVVICAYTMDRLGDIRRAIASVRGQTYPVEEVILIVDHNDELFALAREEFGDTRVVANAETRGLSGGRNTGIANATADIVAFLDDDAEADPGWLQTMMPWYDEPAVIAVGGTSEAVWHDGRPGWFPPEFDWVVGCSYKGLPTAPADVRNLIGSNMSFRRDVFRRIGGFHYAIGRIGTKPVGCEETELCIRAVREMRGSRIVYDPAVRVRHHLPEGRSRWRYFRARCYAEGLSKAIVAELVGADRGLASERAYTTRTLPAGFLTGLRDAATKRSVVPLARSGAIIAGLAITTAGYAAGSARRLWSRVDRAPDNRPTPPEIGVRDS